MFNPCLYYTYHFYNSQKIIPYCINSWWTTQINIKIKIPYMLPIFSTQKVELISNVIKMYLF